MILQNLLRPSPERCTEKELYCREENGQLIFNTWFNLFSVGKWLEYTEIRQFSLKLRAAGSFEVKLFDRNGELSGRTCCFAEETELTIPIPWKDDSFCIWFSFEARDKDAAILSPISSTPVSFVPIFFTFSHFVPSFFVHFSTYNLFLWILSPNSSSFSPFFIRIGLVCLLILRHFQAFLSIFASFVP